MHKKSLYENDFNRSNNKLEPLKIHSSLYTAKKTFT